MSHVRNWLLCCDIEDQLWRMREIELLGADVALSILYTFLNHVNFQPVPLHDVGAVHALSKMIRELYDICGNILYRTGVIPPPSTPRSDLYNKWAQCLSRIHYEMADAFCMMFDGKLKGARAVLGSIDYYLCHHHFQGEHPADLYGLPATIANLFVVSGTILAQKYKRKDVFTTE
jgi:hypothetical protein